MLNRRSTRSTSDRFVSTGVSVALALASLASLVGLAGAIGCGPRQAALDEAAPANVAQEAPAILLVTLDTTRADSIDWTRRSDEGSINPNDPGSSNDPGSPTPNLATLAERGVRFSQAYTTAPMTLPAHASILTGLLPKDHGLHENAGFLDPDHPNLAATLNELGYRTAAFVSAFPLDRQFGLNRGFDHYDDTLGDGLAERDAAATTDRVLDYLGTTTTDDDRPLFLWVHYYDAHEPYEPPEPMRSRFADDPYLGEIAFVDEQLGRLIAAFEERIEPPRRMVIVGDHGESRGDHGEAYHGNLLYQGVMRVPLVMIDGESVDATVEEPVSATRLFELMTNWATGETDDLTNTEADPVLAEAMKPYLNYGWQPQVMGVYGNLKVIRSGVGSEAAIEVYDVVNDPAESETLIDSTEIDRELMRAVRDYPLPTLPDPNAANSAMSAEDRAKLASLGYVGGATPIPLRSDAPHAREMIDVFADLDLGSGLFVRERYAEAIPVLNRILQRDPQNLTVVLRLAVAHSVTAQPSEADRLFARARGIAPDSLDVQTYLGLHRLRQGDWQSAAPYLELVAAAEPRRLPVLRGLVEIRRRQGRLTDAVELLQRIVDLESEPVRDLIQLGDASMANGQTLTAIDAYERARSLFETSSDSGGAFEPFPRSLELGVLLLADHRFEEARDSLDQVPPDHFAYPMALFKRAQVSVLLAEPDRRQRVRAAWNQADETTRQLILNEPLFSEINLSETDLSSGDP